MAVFNRFGVLDTIQNPVKLWDTFKGMHGVVSVEKLESIEESRPTRLAGNRDKYSALSRRDRTLLRRDKER